MRCPKCKCEVGSQKLCPYCGSPMIVPESKNSQSPETLALNRLVKAARILEGCIQRMENKLQIMLVLQGGIFALLVLIFAAILAK